MGFQAKIPSLFCHYLATYNFQVFDLSGQTWLFHVRIWVLRPFTCSHSDIFNFELGLKYPRIVLTCYISGSLGQTSVGVVFNTGGNVAQMSAVPVLQENPFVGKPDEVLVVRSCLLSDYFFSKAKVSVDAAPPSSTLHRSSVLSDGVTTAIDVERIEEG